MDTSQNFSAAEDDVSRGQKRTANEEHDRGDDDQISRGARGGLGKRSDMGRSEWGYVLKS